MPLQFNAKKGFVTERSLRRYASPETKRRAKEMRKNLTPAEARLYSFLKKWRRPGFKSCAFRRQCVIRGWIADFWSPCYNLVIEVDGPSHVGKEEHDAFRDLTMNRIGIKVLRVTNDDVFNNIEGVLQRIREAVA